MVILLARWRVPAHHPADVCPVGERHEHCATSIVDTASTAVERLRGGSLCSLSVCIPGSGRVWPASALLCGAVSRLLLRLRRRLAASVMSMLKSICSTALPPGYFLSCRICVLDCNPVGLRLIDPGLECAASGMMGVKNWMLSVVVAWYDDFYDISPYQTPHSQTHPDHRRHHFVGVDPCDAVHRVA